MFKWVKSYTGHMKNIGLWVIQIFQMLTYHSTVLQTFANMTADFSRQYWEAVRLMVTDNKFSKILIFAWAFGSYHWQQILSNCFPWSRRLTSLIFEKMFARYPNLNNHSSSEVLSNKNGVTWKKWLASPAL